MIARLKIFTRQLFDALLALAASNYAFYVVIALAIFQGGWYALSFQPWINDEARHLGNIQVYSQHLSPFLGLQNPAWDHLGQIVRDGSYLFYYAMSWPLRMLQLVTDSQTAQIIGLRLICLGFFVVGLVMYRRALLEIGRLPKSVVHLALLFFVLTPAAGLLAGMVNYDNLVFLFFSYMFLLTVRVVKSGTLKIENILTIAITGLLMSLIKWSSIALFAPVAIFLAHDLYKKYKRQLVPTFISALRQLPKLQLGLFVAGLVISLGLFIERPVLNIIRYGSPEVSCQTVIGAERCLKSADYVSYAQLGASKPADFRAYDPARYFFNYWVPTVTDKASNLIERGRESELPIIKAFTYGMAYLWAVVVLVAFRQLYRNKHNRLMLIIIVTYVGLLLLDEYSGYLHYGAPVAIRARYLVPVLPIALYIGAAAIMDLFGKYRKTLAAFAVLALIVLTQGGGITTHLFTAPGSAYWHNSRARQVNTTLKNMLDPAIKR